VTIAITVITALGTVVVTTASMVETASKARARVRVKAEAIARTSPDKDPAVLMPRLTVRVAEAITGPAEVTAAPETGITTVADLTATATNVLRIKKLIRTKYRIRSKKQWPNSVVVAAART
jgi:hypothetical protein